MQEIKLKVKLKSDSKPPTSGFFIRGSHLMF